MHLEKHIYQRLQDAGATKHLNPYQGLKPLISKWWLRHTAIATKHLNPYQGLKLRDLAGAGKLAIGSYKAPESLSGIETVSNLTSACVGSFATKHLNPYQGLKRARLQGCTAQ